MKKLVVLGLAVMALTCAVQANCVKWAFTSRYTTSKAPEDPIDLSGYTAYIVLASNWTDGKFETLDSNKIGTAGITKTVSGTTTTYGTGTIESSTTMAASSEKQTFAIVIVNDSDHTHYYSGTTQATVYEAGATSGVTQGSWSMAGTNAMTITQFNSNTFADAQNVPEPTSGLLLLVGVGMLALRRKQK